MNFSRPNRRPLRLTFPVLLTCGGAAVAGCLPPVEQVKAEHAAAVEKTDKEATEFLGYSWADCSGADGKGGTKLAFGPNKKLALRRDVLKASGDASTKKHPKWLLFQDSGKAVAFEWTWVTTEQEKYWGQMWGGGGIAFDSSWSSVDASLAKYLVFFAKVSEPMPELEMMVQMAAKSGGTDVKTGEVNVAQFAEGKKVGTEWTRVIVPLNAIPDLSKIDLHNVQHVAFAIRGKFPENKPLWFRVGDMYFSDADMITPVDNVGYVPAGKNTLVLWDKEPGEKVKAFVVKVDGKELARVPAAEHRAKVAIDPGAHKIVVQAAGDTGEMSTPITVDAKIEAPSPKAATITIAAQPGHEISRWIYGTNYASGEITRDVGFTINRWGGNATSKYNWKRDLSSAGGDWFFLNQYSKPDGTPEDKKSYYAFIKSSLDNGSQVNFTIPMLPFVAKPAGEGERLCAYPKSVFPKQEKIGGEGCGNGKTPDGKDFIWDNDPNIAFVQNSPEFQKGLVENIKKLFGGAAGKGVQFYQLDNEPALWRENHRDVMPKGISSEGLAELGYKYGSMIKSVDPAAKVIGFSAWGVMEAAGSNVDFTPPGEDGYKRYDKYKDEASERWRDVKAHGGDSNLVTYLKTLKKLDGGRHVVDIIDVHWYPEITYKGKKLSDGDIAFDPDIADHQFEALREFWDPTFKLSDHQMDCWTNNASLRSHLWEPFHPVIPALKKWIDQAYPGTKLAINEYSTGSVDKYHGALLRAVALGTFVQEDLYMAENWYQTGKDNFTYWAQKLFTNYDGKGGGLYGKFVKTTSSSNDLYSYAAQNGDKIVLVLINKNQKSPFAVTLELPKAAKNVQTYTLTQSAGLRHFAGDSRAVTGQRASVEIPALSAEVVVLQ
jgi:hypothetical protein